MDISLDGARITKKELMYAVQFCLGDLKLLSHQNFARKSSLHLKQQSNSGCAVGCGHGARQHRDASAALLRRHTGHNWVQRSTCRNATSDEHMARPPAATLSSPSFDQQTLHSRLTHSQPFQVSGQPGQRHGDALPNVPAQFDRRRPLGGQRRRVPNVLRGALQRLLRLRWVAHSRKRRHVAMMRRRTPTWCPSAVSHSCRRLCGQ